MDRVAILLDGEFVRKSLQRGQAPVDVDDVMAEVARIRAHPAISELTLYRIYYYTADPIGGTVVHPLTKVETDLSKTTTHHDGMRFIDRIENQPDVAVRRGNLIRQGWALGAYAERSLVRGRKDRIEPSDLVPKIQQKGVDMRIGLDIASLVLKQIVSTIVVVTGDSDLVPALKFARREGLRVILDPLGARNIRPELRKHADQVLDRASGA